MAAFPLTGRVAVVIPVFRAGFLAEALRSVIGQSSQPDEIIVVDDGSPDQQLLADAIAPYADRIALLRQTNQGAGAARNRGVRATSAPFVAFLDADDRWLPNFLVTQLTTLEKRPSLHVVYSDAFLIGSSGLAGRTFMSVCPSRGEVTFERLLSQECTVPLSTVVARRDAIEAVGGFDETLRRGQDFDLWLRMARHGAVFDYHRTVLAHRRFHDANLSGTSLNEIERPIRVLEKLLATLTLNERERSIAAGRLRHLKAQLALERGKELLGRGDLAAARSALGHACRDQRTWKVQAALIGLRVAPYLVRRLYLSRHRSRQRSQRSGGETQIRDEAIEVS